MLLLLCSISHLLVVTVDGLLVACLVFLTSGHSGWAFDSLLGFLTLQ